MEYLAFDGKNASSIIHDGKKELVAEVRLRKRGSIPLVLQDFLNPQTEPT